jgi:hypothetical protein
MQGKIAILFIAVAFIVTSCIEEINLDTKDSQVITVNCILTNSSQQVLQLCYSKKNSDQDFIPVTNADVRLYCAKNSDTTLVGTFNYSGASKWLLNYTPQLGTDYILNVKVDNYRLISAKTSMPRDFSVETKSYPQNPSSSEYINAKGCKIITDYDCTLWVYGKNKGNVFPPAINEIVSLITTNHRNVDNFNLSDYSLNNYTGEIKNNGLSYYSEFTFYLHNYYLRLEHPKSYTNSYGYRLLSDNSPGPDGNSWGPLFLIAGTFTDYAEIEFMNVSPEYDKYIKTSYNLWKAKKDESDFTSIFVNTMAFSNIENGIGIFGASFNFTLADFNLVQL